MTKQTNNKNVSKPSDAYIESEEIARLHCYWSGYMTEKEEKEFLLDNFMKANSKA